MAPQGPARRRMAADTPRHPTPAPRRSPSSPAASTKEAEPRPASATAQPALPGAAAAAVAGCGLPVPGSPLRLVAGPGGTDRAPEGPGAPGETLGGPGPERPVVPGDTGAELVGGQSQCVLGRGPAAPASSGGAFVVCQ